MRLVNFRVYTSRLPIPKTIATVNSFQFDPGFAPMEIMIALGTKKPFAERSIRYGNGSDYRQCSQVEVLKR